MRWCAALRGAERRRAVAALLAVGALVATASVLPVVVAPPAGAAGQAPAAGMSGAQIAAAPRAPLAQGVAPVPAGAQVRGAVPPTTPVSVDVALTLPDAGGLSSFVAAVSTPGSPEHGHYLTPAAFATRFGPPPSTVAAVDRWLTAEGLTVGPTPGDRMYVPATGPAADVAAAFGTALSTVRLPSGHEAFLPTAAPTVPTPVAPTVSAVIGLSTVEAPHPMLTPGDALAGTAITPSPSPSAGTSAATAAQVIGAATPPAACAAGRGTGSARSYTRIAGIYDMTSLYRQGRSGAGVTVAVVELEGYTEGELAGFEACYGVDPTVRDIPVDGGPAASTTASPGLESSLDIETIAAMAPSATINVFQGPLTGTGSYDVLHAIATTGAASVVSTSWGECEPGAKMTPASPPLAEARFFEQMAAEGKTVVAAAGDSGSEGCWYTGTRPGTPIPPGTTRLFVDDPASQPTVMGVGGTKLGPTTAAAAQVVWNTGEGTGAGGGGVSTLWSMPEYQLAVAPHARTYPLGRATCPYRATTTVAPTGCRAVPDVSADAAPSTGYVVYYDGRWRSSGIGGTSAGAPLWAALFALVDQGCATSVGEANPALYRLGAGSPAFTDITTGDNDLTGTHGTTYPAAPGYDLASGLGTPDGAQLFAALRPGGCPAVTGLSAHDGPLGGGSTLTVRGSDLAGATEVHFGASAASVQSSTTTSVTVVVPASAALDTVDVTVTTANGTSAAVAADQYSYVHAGGGYWVVAADGGIFAFGHTQFHGSMGGKPLNAPVVGIADTPDDGGYWEVAADGGIFAFGDAGFHGSMGGRPLDAPVVGIAATPDGQGYWEVAADGGIFAFGDAGFYGSMGGRPLNAPVVGMVAARNGQGYWEVAADGGIFAFGDAGFSGSMGGRSLDAPVVGIAATPDGQGYWEVAADGGIFAFGDAGFSGSMGGRPLDAPVVGIAATPDGQGYWEVAADGGIFAFGDAGFYGSMGGRPLNVPVVGMATA